MLYKMFQLVGTLSSRPLLGLCPGTVVRGFRPPIPRAIRRHIDQNVTGHITGKE